MRSFGQKNRSSHGRLGEFVLVCFCGGALLLFFVWWPIQAQRALRQMAEWEEKVAIKKAELNALKTRYTSLTSPNHLDQWASKNGPWRAPHANDLILIEN